MIGLHDALGGEILVDFAQYIMRAGLDVTDHQGFGIVLRFGAAKPELFRGPEAQKLVAARGRLETKFFVVREFLFEAFFALIERGHAIAS